LIDILHHQQIIKYKGFPYGTDRPLSAVVFNMIVFSAAPCEFQKRHHILVAAQGAVRARRNLRQAAIRETLEDGLIESGTVVV
jgi:hypothetical protein